MTNRGGMQPKGNQRDGDLNVGELCANDVTCFPLEFTLYCGDRDPASWLFYAWTQRYFWETPETAAVGRERRPERGQERRAA